jgi:hypothetical protein
VKTKNATGMYDAFVDLINNSINQRAGKKPRGMTDASWKKYKDELAFAMGACGGYPDIKDYMPKKKSRKAKDT